MRLFSPREPENQYDPAYGRDGDGRPIRDPGGPEQLGDDREVLERARQAEKDGDADTAQALRRMLGD